MPPAINRCPSPRKWEKMLRWADKVIKETPGGDTDDEEEEEGLNIQRLPSPAPSTSSTGGANPGNAPGLPAVPETPDARRLAFEAAWPGYRWEPCGLELTDAEFSELNTRLDEEERRRPFHVVDGRFVPMLEGWKSGGTGFDEQDQRDSRKRLPDVRTSPPLRQRQSQVRPPPQRSASAKRIQKTGGVTRQKLRGRRNKKKTFWELDQKTRLSLAGAKPPTLRSN